MSSPALELSKPPAVLELGRLVAQHGASAIARRMRLEDAQVQVHASGFGTPRPRVRERYLAAYGIPLEAWSIVAPVAPRPARPPPFPSRVRVNLRDVAALSFADSVLVCVTTAAPPKNGVPWSKALGEPGAFLVARAGLLAFLSFYAPNLEALIAAIPVDEHWVPTLRLGGATPLGRSAVVGRLRLTREAR